MLILGGCSLLVPCMVLAQDFFIPRNSVSLLGGYGQSEPRWGQTTQKVQTIDVIPRYSHVIWDNIGSGWYQGYHSIMMELPFSIVLHPDTSGMVGMNFLATYTFTADDVVQPYIFGGGGPVYSFADIPGMGSEVNGNYQFGGGMRYNITPDHALLFEIRYHHISNGGRDEPNEPLNSWKALMGLTF